MRFLSAAAFALLICIAPGAQAATSTHTTVFPPENLAECGTNGKTYLSWQGEGHNVRCEQAAAINLPTCAAGEALTSTDGINFTCVPGNIPNCATGQALTSVDGTHFQCATLNPSIPVCASGQVLTSADGTTFTCVPKVPSCPAGDQLVSTGSGNWTCETPSTTPPASSGCPTYVSVGGYRWYQGNAGDSCDTVCASRGGCNLEGTRDYAGSGGTNANCQAVFDAFYNWCPQHPSPYIEYNFSDRSVVTISAYADGCSVYFGKTYALYRFTPATTCSSAHRSARFCACNN